MQMWQLHNDPELIGSLRELEGHVGLSVGFILGCLQEDDWSMVIKMHALLEASLSRIIVYALGDDRLSDIITRVDFGDAKKGKVKIASTLGLIEKDEARFLRWFTELRNTLVHNVSNVNFNFKEYYEALADREKDRIIKEDVIDPDDPFVAQLHVVGEWGALVE